MRGCNIYPVLFQEYRCKECVAYERCCRHDEERYVYVKCSRCGFVAELKLEYVKDNVVVCPFCKDVEMKGK
jgi:hypothetical protein